VAAYNSDPDSISADFVIRVSNNALQYDDALFVVDKVSKNYYNTEQDMAMYMLTGMLGGVQTTVYVDPSSSVAEALVKLKRGDVIRYLATADNTIYAYEPISIANNTGVKLTNATNGVFSTSSGISITIINGVVYKKKDGVIVTNQFGYEQITPEALRSINWKTTTLLYSNVTDAAIIVVDSKDERVYSGSIADIRDYESYVSKASRVLMRYRSNALKEIVVFND
jgi:hypothetical protein